MFVRFLSLLSFSIFCVVPVSLAEDVAVELSLLVDVSGSVDRDEFELQKQGYVLAFQSAEVQQAISRVGSIAVNLIYWSGTRQQVEAIPFTKITSATASNFASLIDSTERGSNGATAIGAAIEFAVPLFDNQFTSQRQIIDISGDGRNNAGPKVETARQAAIAAGIDSINGLPIGGSQRVIDHYVNSVIAGPDAFVEPAKNFADVASAVTRKITREIGTIDLCPEDPNKFDPGDCGCGIAESDCGTPQPTTTEETACNDGIDNDADGRIDFSPNGQGDPGCSSSDDKSEDDEEIALKSPAFGKFNTFLGQQVYAEIINQGSSPKEVGVSLHNLRGQLMITQKVLIPGSSQFDVDINALLQQACRNNPASCSGFEDLSATQGANNGLGQSDGVVDTYGLVRLNFDDSDPSSRILGRLSFYRLSPQGGFSFALARELRNPQKGPAYVMANTIDPQGLGSLVPNWAEIISIGKSNPGGEALEIPLSYTINLYSETGKRLSSSRFTLTPLGEIDIAAGHEFTDSNQRRIEGVYLVEVIPQDSDSEYFLSLGRYVARSAPSGNASDYHYALSIDGKPGTEERVYTGARNKISGFTSTTTTTNWLETACVSTTSCRAEVRLRSISGRTLETVAMVLSPKSQRHLNISALLGSNSEGSIEITSTGKVISQSMSYIHSDSRKPLVGFAQVTRPLSRSRQAGSLNTNIGMRNQINLYSTGSKAIDIEIAVTPVGSSRDVISRRLSAAATQVLNAEGSALGFPSNSYGLLEVNTDENGVVNADILRLRINSEREIEFVVPTIVR